LPPLACSARRCGKGWASSPACNARRRGWGKHAPRDPRPRPARLSAPPVLADHTYPALLAALLAAVLVAALAAWLAMRGAQASAPHWPGQTMMRAAWKRKCAPTMPR
jgi:hypothetical protein